MIAAGVIITTLIVLPLFLAYIKEQRSIKKISKMSNSDIRDRRQEIYEELTETILPLHVRDFRYYIKLQDELNTLNIQLAVRDAPLEYFKIRKSFGEWTIEEQRRAFELNVK